MPEPLTPRETTVIRLIAEGHTQNEIARSIGIAPSTLRDANTTTYRKLGARNAAHAVAICARANLITLTGVRPTRHDKDTP